MSILWELYWSFFRIGLFTIGGGYAALPLIEAQIVNTKGWLTIAEFADLLTISEMTPGPIGINAATFVGTHVAGLPGAIIATVGTVTPSVIIVLTLAYVYYKYRNLDLIKGVLQGLRPAIVGMIASAGIGIVLTVLFGSNKLPINFDNFSWQALLIFVGAFLIMRKWKLNPILIIVFCGAVGFVTFTVFGV